MASACDATYHCGRKVLCGIETILGHFQYSQRVGAKLPEKLLWLRDVVSLMVENMFMLRQAMWRVSLLTEIAQEEKLEIVGGWIQIDS